MEISESIISTLMYFDIFSYPLTQPELFQFARVSLTNPAALNDHLQELLSSGQIFNIEGFYALRNDHEIVSRRKKGNLQAKLSMTSAVNQSKKISKFPFVKAVMVSGSLSKNYMEPDSDLDFFIVTAPKRVWICRALLALYKRFFLNNSHRLFCTNYFIDTDHLMIEEQNLFTATELITLLPVLEKDLYTKLIIENENWLRTFYPNFISRSQYSNDEAFKPIFKTCVEWVINLTGASFVNERIMNFAVSRWRKQFGSSYTESEFKIAFKSAVHTSKHHPRNFQRVVMDKYLEAVSVRNTKRNLLTA